MDNEKYKEVLLKREFGKTLVDWLDKKYPITEDTDLEVLITFSEAEVLYSFDEENPVRLSWEAATELLKILDSMPGYNKKGNTWITLRHVDKEHNYVNTYDLRYDLCSGEGGIYQHIQQDPDNHCCKVFWLDLLESKMPESVHTPLSAT